MSLDAMKQVAAAENTAKQSLQEATAASKQMIADAETQGRASFEARLNQAEAEVKRMMAEAEATGAQNTADTLRHADNQCAVLRAHAEGRLDQASDRIVERIVIG